MDTNPESAPGDLETLREFINTGEPPGALIPHEDFDSPESLAKWLAERKLLDDGERLSTADLSRTIVFRETLRDALESGEQPPSTEALERLERGARQIRFRVSLTGSADGPVLAPDAAGLDAALGRLLAILYQAMHDQTWERLKACREPTCRFAFFDRSKNRSRSWCDMSTCGNRSKARRRRARSG